MKGTKGLLRTYVCTPLNILNLLVIYYTIICTYNNLFIIMYKNNPNPNNYFVVVLFFYYYIFNFQFVVTNVFACNRCVPLHGL